MIESAQRYIQVDIADVSRQIFSGLCCKVVAPAILGEVCILPRHSPLMTRLIPGEVRLETQTGENLLYYVSGGLMEVQATIVTLLCDQTLRAEDIDQTAALNAKREAEQILAKSPLYSERDEAKLQLAKAIAQLRLLDDVRTLRLKKGR